MPRTALLFYQDADGAAPVWEWLRELRSKQPKAYAKCVVRLRRLAEFRHELRRPEADLLQEGIYEPRARLGTVNYRILYFFHGRNVAVLAHAITKENDVPSVEIKRSVERKLKFLGRPAAHTFNGEIKMPNQKTEKHSSDALVLLAELTGSSREMAELIEQEKANLDMARKIFELRTRAELSQAQLARKVGTTQSVISRLEDADYDGHALAMLRRIAAVLEKRVEIRFIALRKPQPA